jgi:hypothetical protein
MTGSPRIAGINLALTIKAASLLGRTGSVNADTRAISSEAPLPWKGG